MVACSDAETKPQPVAVVQATQTATGDLRDIMFVIDGSNNMGGDCRRLYDAQQDKLTDKVCAPAAAFEAQRKGILQAIRALPHDGSVSVGLVLGTRGARSHVTAGPFAPVKLILPPTRIASEKDADAIVAKLAKPSDPMCERQVDCAQGLSQYRWPKEACLLEEIRDPVTGTCVSGMSDFPGGIKAAADQLKQLGRTGARQEICATGVFYDWGTWPISGFETSLGTAASYAHSTACPDGSPAGQPCETVDRITYVGTINPGVYSQFYYGRALISIAESPRFDGYIDIWASPSPANSAVLRKRGAVGEAKIRVSLVRGQEPKLIAKAIAEAINAHSAVPRAAGQPAPGSVPLTALASEGHVWVRAHYAEYDPALNANVPMSTDPPVDPSEPSKGPRTYEGVDYGLFAVPSAGADGKPIVELRIVQPATDANCSTNAINPAYTRDEDGPGCHSQALFVADVVGQSLAQGDELLLPIENPQLSPYNWPPLQFDAVSDQLMRCVSQPALLEGIEVNQVIQDLGNTVPLIEGKPTTVRAAVSSFGLSQRVDLKLRVFRCEALGAEQTEAGTPCKRLQQLTPAEGLRKADITTDRKDAIRFDLAREWLHGRIELQVERTDGDLRCSEPIDGDTKAINLTPDCRSTVSFAPSPDMEGFRQGLRMTPFRVGYRSRFRTSPLDDNPQVVFQMPDAESVASSQLLVDPFMPVTKVTRNPTRPLYIGGDRGIIDASDPKIPDHFVDELLPALFFTKAYECRRTCEIGAVQGAFVGPQGAATLKTTGLAAIGCGASVYQLGNDPIITNGTAVHEFAHGLGRKHIIRDVAGTDIGGDADGELTEPFPWSSSRQSKMAPLLGPAGDGEDAKVWGYWPGRAASPLEPDRIGSFVVDPEDAAEFMAYHQSRWISSWTYARLFRRQTIANPAGGGPVDVGGHIAEFVNSPWQRVALDCAVNWPSFVKSIPGAPAPVPTTTCGPVDRTCGGMANPSAATIPVRWVQSIVYKFGTELSADFRASMHTTYPASPVTDGEQVARFEDAQGNVLNLISFSIYSTLAQTATDDTQLAAPVSLFVPDDPALARIRFLDGDTEFGRVEKSANAPQVEILTPNTGDILGTSAHWSWSANDADGDALSHFVEYSPDGGNRWMVVAINYADSTLDVDLSGLPGGTNSYLRVTSSDGFDSATDMVGPFSVATKSPVLNLARPLSGQRFAPGELIILEVQATDAEDGPLDPAHVLFSSDRDGVLGTGLTHLQASQLSTGTHVLRAVVSDSEGKVTSAEVTIEIGEIDPQADQTQLELVPTSVHAGDFRAGDVGSYHLSVVNTGNQPSPSGIQLNDRLPAELQFVDADGAGAWSCSHVDSLVTCTYTGPELQPGEGSAAVRIDVLPSDGGIDPAVEPGYDVINRVSVTFPSDVNDNQAQDPTHVVVPQPPALDVQSTREQGSIFSGDTVHYTLNIANSAGAGPARSVSVDLTAPQGTQITRASGDAWTCQSSGNTGTCDYTGSALEAGEALPALFVDVFVPVAQAGAVGLQYSVRATGTTRADAGTPMDGGMAADAGSVTVDVSGEDPAVAVQNGDDRADLSVEIVEECDFDPYFCNLGRTVLAAENGAPGPTVQHQEWGDTPRRQGGAWGHVIVIRNRGNKPLVGPIRVVDRLPETLTGQLAREFPHFGSYVFIFGVEQAGPRWECQIQGSLISCDFQRDRLEAGDVTAIQIGYTIASDAPLRLTNTVEVITDDEAEYDNNTASYTLELPNRVCVSTEAFCVPPSDTAVLMAVDVSDVPDTLEVGQPGEATFTVVNRGTRGVLKNNIVLDALGAPSMLQVQTVTGSGWVCAPDWGSVNCRFSDLANGTLAVGAALPPLHVTYTVGPYMQPFMLVGGTVSENGASPHTGYTTAAVIWDHYPVFPQVGTLAFTSCAPFYCDSREFLTPTASSVRHEPRYPAVSLLEIGPDVLPERRLPVNFTYGHNQTWLHWDEALAWLPDGSSVVQMTMVRPFMDSGAPYRYVIQTRADERFWVSQMGARTGRQASRFWYTSIFDWLPRGFALAPDGGTLAFSRNGHLDIGFNVTTLPASTTDGYPAWSRDGKTIAYTSGTVPKIWLTQVAKPGNVWTTTPPVRLTSTPASRSEQRPTWSPDGTQLAFAADGRIQVINADGSGEHPVTLGPNDNAPSFSPDGQVIAFERGAKYPIIFMVDLTTGTETPIAPGSWPTWRPVAGRATPPPSTHQNPIATTDRAVTGYAAPITLDLSRTTPTRTATAYSSSPPLTAHAAM